MAAEQQQQQMPMPQSSGEEDDIVEQSDEENKTTEDDAVIAGDEGETQVKKVKKKRTGQNTGGYQLSINTCNARSDLALLQELILQNNWREVHIREQKADLIW